MCGTVIRAADVAYACGWTWRARYGMAAPAHGALTVSGLSTGVGAGSQGVKCGACERCMARVPIVDEDGVKGVVGAVVDDPAKIIPVTDGSVYTLTDPDDGERSWCAWCKGIIPGRGDLDALPALEKRSGAVAKQDLHDKM
ncbi:MAG: hypothetical protein M1838_006157 [Thelocarpon superellum]|nr:MAG: hypothetical protein M1838_006157 [Thelocarpon superellum]